MASIYRRRGGWRVSIRRHGQSVSKDFARRDDAARWALKTEAEIERKATEKPVLPSRRRKMPTLAEGLDRYQREVVPDLKGAKQVSLRIQAWKRVSLAKRPLDEITSMDVAAWRDGQKHRAPTTVTNALSIISAVFELAQKEWGFPELTNPTRMIRKPRQRPGRTRRLGPGEEESLRAAFQQIDDPWLEPAFTLAIETGMRQGELLSAKRSNIDGPVLMLPDTKTNEPREVPLSSRALAAIRTLPLSVDRRLVPLTTRQLTWRFERACKIAGIEGLRWHDLRREAISRMFEAGLAIPEVAAISGHRTWSMLARYTRTRTLGLVSKLG